MEKPTIELQNLYVPIGSTVSKRTITGSAGSHAIQFVRCAFGGKHCTHAGEGTGVANFCAWPPYTFPQIGP
jgi:hypothetical protein